MLLKNPTVRTLENLALEISTSTKWSPCLATNTASQVAVCFPLLSHIIRSSHPIILFIKALSKSSLPHLTYKIKAIWRENQKQNILLCQLQHITTVARLDFGPDFFHPNMSKHSRWPSHPEIRNPTNHQTICNTTSHGIRLGHSNTLRASPRLSCADPKIQVVTHANNQSSPRINSKYEYG